MIDTVIQLDTRTVHFHVHLMPNGISVSNQLDQSISILRVVGRFFSFLFRF